MKANIGIARSLPPAPIERLTRTFQRFAQIEGFSGIVLLAAALWGLFLANSRWAEAYFSYLDQHVILGFGQLMTLDLPLSLWINDGLMAIFFFVVGLEIKREVMIGELSSARKATLPFLAAVGGMIVPAGIYLLFNAGRPGQNGWGIPMATDIAFALGALSLLGRRVPVSLKIFLTALAIVDDLGAVLVIAIFYTQAIHWLALGFAGVALILLLIYNRIGGRNLLVYSLLGFLVWVDFFFSGVHATVAGVLAAMTIPVRTRIDAQGFLEWGRSLLDGFEQSGAHGHSELISAQQRTAVYELEKACEHVETPLHRLEAMLHPWVAYLIMPVFALANAGVAFSAETVRNLGSAVGMGILFGLVAGKFIGIFVATFLAVRFKLANLPRNVRWSHIVGVACLGGMGFTMSLFIAGLAFGDSGHASAMAVSAKLASPALLDVGGAELLHDVSKLAILLASLIAGILGSVLLLRVPVLSEADAAAEE